MSYFLFNFRNQEINCPVTEEPGTESTASTPIKLMEIKTKNGETTIYNCKSETLEEAEELAANQYEQEMALKKADWTHCYPITIREIKRSHASQIILEEKPVCPGDEGPTLVCTEEKPVCPMDENITEEEINSCPGEIVGTESTTPSTPIKLIEVKKNNGEKILYKCKTETLEEAEELAAKQCEEEMTLKKTDCYPIEIREVKKKQDLKIILKGNPVCPMEEEAIIVCEEKEKRFNPLKKSHQIIERRSEQQIAEYGPPEEQNPTFKIVEEPICPRDENSTYEEVTPIKIREYKRSHASQIILERKPVCPGDEEPTLVFTEEKPVCPGDEEPTLIFTEEKPVCPGDEEPTLVCTEEKSVCPGDEEPTLVCTEEKPVCPEDEKITSPVILKEVTTNKGEVTIYKRKQKKRWSPFKKSHKIIERRSQQQIAEYGPSEEQNPTCNVAEPTKVCEEVAAPTKVCEEVAEPTKVCEEVAEPTKVCEEVTEPIKVCEDLPGTKNQLKIALHAKSFIFSILLALIIFVGVKVAFPEVDLQMIGGMSMIGFLVSLLVHQWFISNNSECCHCHVLSGEECTCHTLFGIYFGLLI